MTLDDALKILRNPAEIPITIRLDAQSRVLKGAEDGHLYTSKQAQETRCQQTPKQSMWQFLSGIAIR